METQHKPSQPDGPPAEVAVYFDGSCPMCSKEISYYQGLDKASRVQWIDVSGENPSCPIGFDQRTLMERFHVKDLAKDQIHHGAAGFTRLWCALPQPWHILGKICSFAPITWALELGYILTLKVRPLLARRFFKGS
jgi:predicted DCC family thiol-disulfide oxidoreductase YuxK